MTPCGRARRLVARKARVKFRLESQPAPWRLRHFPGRPRGGNTAPVALCTLSRKWQEKLKLQRIVAAFVKTMQWAMTPTSARRAGPTPTAHISGAGCARALRAMRSWLPFIVMTEHQCENPVPPVEEMVSVAGTLGATYRVTTARCMTAGHLLPATTPPGSPRSQVGMRTSYLRAQPIAFVPSLKVGDSCAPVGPFAAY